MKRFCQLLFCLLTAIPTIAQDKNDSAKFRLREIFICGGLNTAQYYSGNFFQFIADRSFTPTNAGPGPITYYPPAVNVSGNTTPAILSSTNFVFSPAVSFGAVFSSGKSKKIKWNHSIHVDYLQEAGDYSGSRTYHERWDKYGSPAGGWAADVNDIIDGKYTRRAFILGYRAEPTWKSFFCSMGINLNLNFITENQHQTSTVNGSWYSEDPPFGGTYSRVSSADESSHFYSPDFQLQLGFGTHFKISKINFTPAFYFTPSFTKTYNLYTVSLAIACYRRNN